MKKPIQLFPFIFTFFSIALAAQPDTLRLKGTHKTGALGFRGSSPMIEFRHMSSRNPSQNTLKPIRRLPKGWSKYFRRDIWLQESQIAFQNYKAGRITEERLRRWMDSWEFDTLNLSPDEIRCSIDMVFRRNEAGEAEYALDMNGDMDFSDEEILKPFAKELYDSLQLRDSLLALAPRVPYEISIQGRIVEGTIPIVVATGTMEGHNDFMVYQIPEYYQVVHERDTLIIRGARPTFKYMDVCHKRTINTDAFGASGEERKKGDLLRLGSEWFKVEGFDRGNEELVLTSVDTKTDTTHPQKGFYAPDFSLPSYLTSEELKLEQFKGKYLILDFWGTWCTGCVQVLPEFVEFHEKIKGKPVEILSVACMSNETNFTKLREKYGMDWHHAWQPSPIGIIKDYQVSGYPVYFLIGPDGKILTRTMFLNEIENKLLALLQN